MASEKLTALKVKKSSKPGLYGDGNGLALRIAKGGSKSWVFRYMVDGHAHEMGLGPTHTVSLVEAREAARKARKLCFDGVDPIDQRTQQRAMERLGAVKAMTLRQCAEAYIAAHRAEWTAKNALAWAKTFTDENSYVPTAITALPVAAVDAAVVMTILGPLWEAIPATASRVRGRIESVLDWATASEFRKGENPARWKGYLEHRLAKPAAADAHLAALPYTEIPGFMAALREQVGVGARALEFTILNAARPGETYRATWAEIDLSNKLWVIPGTRMKAGAEHRVPLSDAALAVLDEMRIVREHTTALVFPGARRGRPLSHEAMLRVLKAMGRGDLTAHGFRSSFRDWCGDQTNFPREVCEAALAHNVGDKVELAYRRGSALEKRRQLMAAWARYCDAPAIGKVVALNRALTAAAAG